ncbi:fimbrillin family protein [Hoylesella nanceiensis]|uniref:fimbrillin family protein n=1 Tax=Hoylesella nanceiensis TaxID=425941 RepID=UPI00243165B0|nr:fimbrillin family protein [Hoylesella nanceiensis]
MNRILTLVATVAFALSFASCSDTINDEKASSNGLPKYELTVNVGSPETRTLKVANNKVVSYWEDGENFLVYQVTSPDTRLTSYSFLSPSGLPSDAKSARLRGEIDGSLAKGQELAFLYPGNALQTNMQGSARSMQRSEDTDVYKIIEPMELEDGEYVPSKKPSLRLGVNISQQEGTLASLGKLYDLQYGRAAVTELKDGKATATVNKMSRKVAIWAISFKDKDANASFGNIDYVAILGVKPTGQLDLKTGNWVNNGQEGTGTVTLAKKDGSKMNGSDTFYAAIIPGTYTDVTVMVAANNKYYIAKVKNGKEFKEGEIYTNKSVPVSAKETDKPYVEVAGVKWAKGNFIHYVDKATSKEYWGIAPAQWWISRYADQGEGDHGTVIGSQFFKENYKDDVNDIDLFRFGAIKEALNLTSGSGKSMPTNKGLVQKWYKSDGLLAAETTNKAQAVAGDIVWYYTSENHNKYRMPKKSELEGLLNVNSWAAYCYTDKGNKVYGMYFCDPKPGQPVVKATKLNFKKSFYNLPDVTQEVRLGHGLFLPLNGNRGIASDKVRFRDLGSRRLISPYSLYVSGDIGALLQTWELVMGDSFRMQTTQHSQAKTIRPVFVSTDNQKDTFAPFEGIR